MLAQLRRLPSKIHLASILARKPGVHVHPRVSSWHRQANVGFQRTDVLRTDVHLFHHTPLREEQAGELAHAQLPVVKPHHITSGHPSEHHILERRPTEQSDDIFARYFGFQLPLPISRHQGRAQLEQSSRDSCHQARWAHPPTTGGDGRSLNCARTKDLTFQAPKRDFLVPDAPKTSTLCTPHKLGRDPWLLICTWGGAQTRDRAIPGQTSSMSRVACYLGR